MAAWAKAIGNDKAALNPQAVRGEDAQSAKESKTSGRNKKRLPDSDQAA
jgi:hypothetical protein